MADKYIKRKASSEMRWLKKSARMRRETEKDKYCLAEKKKEESMWKRKI